MGSSGSKLLQGGASSSSSTGWRGRSKARRVFKSSCLGAPSRSYDSDNDDQDFGYANKEIFGNTSSQALDNEKIEFFSKEKANYSDVSPCISPNVEVDQWVQPNTSSGGSTSQDSSTHSFNLPGRFLSRFSFAPNNVVFRLSRTASLGSSSSIPVSNDSLTMLNGETQQNTFMLTPCLITGTTAHYCGATAPSLQSSSPICDVSPSTLLNQTNCVNQELIHDGGDSDIGDNTRFYPPTVVTDLNVSESRLLDRRGTREPSERNVRFSRTLSVGRLRDRVLRLSSLSDLPFSPLESSRCLRYARGTTGRQAVPPSSSSYSPSTISNSTSSNQNYELETSRSREARYHDLLEHRSNFLERRRRIRSQVRALQQLGSRFENVSCHDRSCALSGHHRTGRCTCRVTNRNGSFGDDASARASISRIVMLAEALFEVLDEIHQQSVVLSTGPSVSSLGSVPAPNEVVESLPLRSYTKLLKGHPEEPAQCYICLVEYDDGDSMRILPCNHEFHGACIDKWLKEVHRVCPLCRGDICTASILGCNELVS